MIKEKTVEILERSPRSKQQREEKRNEPYWDLKRVVLAGWLLRYPGNFFAVVKYPLYILLGIVVVFIYNLVT
tara:strand:- start:228 stop:443 length:216 start_codon:yes stop_codon:yes gene_type:complete